MSSIVFDRKTYAPRFRVRQRKLGLHPRWVKVCDMVRGETVDWNALKETFLHGDLELPKAKAADISKSGHMALKGAYGFFQAGYVVRDRVGRVALFERNKEDPKHPGAKPITSGHSVVLAATPTAISEHRTGMGKLERLMRAVPRLGADFELAQITHTVRPAAIGLTDLPPAGKTPSPAYFWVLHELTLHEEFRPNLHVAPTPGQRLIGFKNPKSLRICKVGGEPPEFERPFERALIRAIQSDWAPQDDGEAARIRPLRSKESKSCRRAVFKRRNARLGRSLTSLALTTAATVKGLDVLSREQIFRERVLPGAQEYGSELLDWLGELAGFFL